MYTQPFYFREGVWLVSVSCSQGLISAGSLFVRFVESFIERHRCTLQLSGNRIHSWCNQVRVSHKLQVRSQSQCVYLIYEHESEECSVVSLPGVHDFVSWEYKYLVFIWIVDPRTSVKTVSRVWVCITRNSTLDSNLRNLKPVHIQLL
jgi:hypothetical protein